MIETRTCYRRTVGRSSTMINIVLYFAKELHLNYNVNFIQTVNSKSDYTKSMYILVTFIYYFECIFLYLFITECDLPK